MEAPRQRAEDFLSYKDLAELWGVSPRTVKRRVSLLKVTPARPIHNRNEFTRSQVEQMDRRWVSRARYCRKNKVPIYAKTPAQS